MTSISDKIKRATAIITGSVKQLEEERFWRRLKKQIFDWYDGKPGLDSLPVPTKIAFECNQDYAPLYGLHG